MKFEKCSKIPKQSCIKNQFELFFKYINLVRQTNVCKRVEYDTGRAQNAP